MSDNMVNVNTERMNNDIVSWLASQKISES